jgi:hypothetical protein
MTNPQWTGKEVLQRFFVHIEQNGPSDLLWPLNSSARPHYVILKDPVAVFETNLLAISRATTTPFYVAMMASQSEKARIVQEMVARAKAGDTPAAVEALKILNNSPKAILDAPIDVFQTMHDNSFLLDSFAALYAQAAVLVWGTLEALLFDCSAELFTRKPPLLNALASVGEQIWGRNPARVVLQLRGPGAAAGGVVPVAAFKALSFSTVQLDRLKPITSLLDPSGHLGAQTDTPVLRMLEGRRHLLVHKGGIVDQKYLTDTGDSLPLGSRITIGPLDLEAYFRAVAAAGLKFADAVEAAA